jgi:serine/threonine protein phosphatase PrpC
MTRKKMDKKISRLESKFHDVLVCKKNNCRPFLEILIEEPENISHQNLGTLVGIFQIDDRSEDSSYVVNYLISIIKKEYFSHANRGPVENFESALHKANLALAKLATHENISWIGKINALCAVIEKNNLLLSQTGNASAFLLRGNTFTEITELPSNEINSNPLKTFQDVISGKIEKNDKLLLTTKELFDIFSLEEIKKSALKFSHENFVQFINTALVNELDQVATLIVDIAEKNEEIIVANPKQKTKEINAFSQNAFKKEPSLKIPEETLKKERQDMLRELQGKATDFVDKKTGHIYIKEEAKSQQVISEEKIEFNPSTFFGEKFSALSLLSIHLFKNAKNITRDSFFSFWQKSRSKIANTKLKDKIIDWLVFVLREPTVILIKLTTLFKKNWNVHKPTKHLNRKLTKILPNFSRLKQIIKNLNRKQRITALVMLILLLVVPYWIVKLGNTQEQKIVTIEELPVIIQPLEKDLNVSRIEKLSEIYPATVQKIINLNAKFFALNETEIIDLENKKSFLIPSDFQNPELFLGMDDLNLIFLIKNNQTISLSPTTGKFQKNTLIFSSNEKIIAAKTYLTYIYLLDTNNNQIYRVPRADGGFGAKTLWIKEDLDLSGATDFVINENIFAINNQAILKLFRGKKLDFSIEHTATTILPNKLYTKNTSTNLYILDATNARIIKIDDTGKILAQYYNQDIATATDFSVHEEANLIYLVDATGVKSFEMN